ncbi:M48 family metallopeptidase [Dethiosulfovibrio sp. F2B]|uniref:M48 family metallopeptidase n=1 Tax=Dethiosulfovibrio faecalis TaxID=2720018 RepID=UPI001F20D964|nr:SprT family zinc-dependent metalloprotease [Dethiosulfovibrio faecalis]MCF4152695.1 M48 family metallopeptidase [Dethiosulfovibrio faecalis]
MMEGLSNSDKRSVVYGQKNINFRLLYCDRKTMEIAVHPDSTVVVKVPIQSDITLIEKKIINRASWILRQMSYFKQFNPRTPERCYVNGETHLYLGKQYRLKLSTGVGSSVKLSRGFFNVTCIGEPTPSVVKRLLNQWYSEKAQIQFVESLDRCWANFRGLAVEKPKLSIRKMKKRWGSLSVKGTMTLNSDLIRAPKECIDYVVMHELCHLKYHDHSPEFYSLLDSLVPGWEKIKHRLELTTV